MVGGRGREGKGGESTCRTAGGVGFWGFDRLGGYDLGDGPVEGA